MSIAEGANAGSPRIFCAMMSLAVIFDLPNSLEILVEMFETSGLADIFKRLLGPGNRKKRNKQLFQKKPQNSDSIYLFPY